MSNQGDEESVQSADFAQELEISNFDVEDEEENEEHLDPRVQVELEKLNASTEVINKFREQLEEAKCAGRQAFHLMTQKLQEIAEKLGKCIQKARPYYEARVDLKKAQTELQQAALIFEKANATLKASKEMVKLTEEGLTRQGGKLDETWQEMLNYATKKVAQCELDIHQRKREHWLASKVYAEGEIKVKLLEKKFKSSINKSKPYYELRAQMNHFVEKEKFKVYQLEHCIAQAKATYKEGLDNLENISDSIHLQRRLREQLQQRDSGCGTISESASLAGSYDLNSVSEVVVEEQPHPSGDRHQHMLDVLHDMIAAQHSDQKPESDSDTRTLRFSDGQPIESVSDQTINAQSYPLLAALGKELNKLQLESSASVMKRKQLHAVPSVDSAVDSAGSECELDTLDDDLVDSLCLDQNRPSFSF